MIRLIVFIGLLLISCGGGDDDGGTTGGSSTIKTTDSKQDEAGMGDDRHDEKVAEVPDTPDPPDHITYSLACRSDVAKCGYNVIGSDQVAAAAYITPIPEPGQYAVQEVFVDGKLYESGSFPFYDAGRHGVRADGKRFEQVDDLGAKSEVLFRYSYQGASCECIFYVHNPQQEESEQ